MTYRLIEIGSVWSWGKKMTMQFFYQMHVFFFLKYAFYVFQIFMKNKQCFCQMWSLIPRNTEVNTLISCVASILRQWTCHIWPDAPFRFIMMVQREQIQAFWQSPIDHHSIYLLYFLLLADTLDVDRSLGWVEFEGLRSCQMWVFNKFDWIFHKITEHGEY